MLVRCPQCQTGYNLPANKLGEGRNVRCVKCGNEWFQKAEEQQPEAPEEPKAPIAPENPQSKADEAASAVSNQRAKLKRRLTIVGVSTASCVLILFSLLVLFKSSIEKSAPAMASFYSAIGLSSAQDERTMSVTGLVIPKENIERILDEDTTPTTYTFVGQVINTNTVAVDIPQIRVSLFNEKGVEIDFWPAQIEKTTLQPGEVSRWVCRFFNPPIEKIYSHQVYFAKSDAK